MSLLILVKDSLAIQSRLKEERGKTATKDMQVSFNSSPLKHTTLHHLAGIIIEQKAIQHQKEQVIHRLRNLCEVKFTTPHYKGLPSVSMENELIDSMFYSVLAPR